VRIPFVIDNREQRPVDVLGNSYREFRENRADRMPWPSDGPLWDWRRLQARRAERVWPGAAAPGRRCPSHPSASPEGATEPAPFAPLGLFACGRDPAPCPRNRR